jgi:hypothetical protein
MQSKRPPAAKRPPTELIWTALFFSLVLLVFYLLAVAILPAFGAPRVATAAGRHSRLKLDRTGQMRRPRMDLSVPIRESPARQPQGNA